MTDLASLRQEYSRASLDLADTLPDPLLQLRTWIGEAERASVPEPNAMTLATATASGRPSARIVLLKGITDDALVFYTDYRSRKAQELDANPQAAVALHWPELERQVRAVGTVSRLDRESSNAYFRTRPVGSRVGAWASVQSSVIADRGVLEREVEKVAQEFHGTDIPLPPHWGGFRIVPDELEFWQGRPSRLHDRIHYTRDRTHAWHRARLSP